MAQLVLAPLVACATLWVSYQAVTTSVEESRLSRAESRLENVKNAETGLAEHYSAAVAELASDSVLERLGGVHSLERIAIASTTMSKGVATRYQSVVLDLLCTFIQQEAPRGQRSPSARSRAKKTDQETRPRLDIAAALKAIEGRPRTESDDSVDLSGADLTGARLDDTQFDEVDFQGTKLAYAQFHTADLNGANFNHADLTGANFISANLSKAVLKEAELTRSKLIGADLTEARLGAADLTKAKLGGAQLTDVRMVGVTMSRADAGGAKLIRVIATNATMDGADLNGADLTNANFSHASLKGVNLNQADLTGTDLTDCTGLTLEQLRSAKTITVHTRLPEGFSWSAADGVTRSVPSTE